MHTARAPAPCCAPRPLARLLTCLSWPVFACVCLSARACRARTATSCGRVSARSTQSPMSAVSAACSACRTGPRRCANTTITRPEHAASLTRWTTWTRVPLFVCSACQRGQKINKQAKTEAKDDVKGGAKGGNSLLGPPAAQVYPPPQPQDPAALRLPPLSPRPLERWRSSCLRRRNWSRSLRSL